MAERDRKPVKPGTTGGEGLRSGKESMKAPGDGTVTSDARPKGRRGEQSAVNDADALDGLMGFDTIRRHEFDEEP